jgi:hypothetical protein
MSELHKEGFQPNLLSELFARVFKDEAPWLGMTWIKLWNNLRGASEDWTDFDPELIDEGSLGAAAGRSLVASAEEQKQKEAVNRELWEKLDQKLQAEVRKYLVNLIREAGEDFEFSLFEIPRFEEVFKDHLKKIVVEMGDNGELDGLLDLEFVNFNINKKPFIFIILDAEEFNANARKDQGFLPLFRANLGKVDLMMRTGVIYNGLSQSSGRNYIAVYICLQENKKRGRKKK